MIKLSKSCLSEAETQAVADVLEREYLGMGEDVQRFEQALEGFFGRPVACVCNGTAALHVALQACGIAPRDEVLVPSLTFVATFQAIAAVGAVPVACDIDEISLILDCADARRRVSERTRAIMPVHYSGGVGPLDEIYSFASEYGLRVIEDAAHAFGTTYRGRRIGGFGDVACFSFDGIKNITAGEGGCIVADDPEVMRHARDIRLLGVEHDTTMRFSGQRSWIFDVKEQGWRYHMSNIMAAIGLVQLGRFDEFSARRRALARRYDALLQGDKRVAVLPRDYDEVTPHLYVVRLIGRLEVERDRIRAQLREQGIETGAHYYPNHLLTYFKTSREGPPLSVTERIYPELLSLPLHPDLAEADIDQVVASLRSALDE